MYRFRATFKSDDGRTWFVQKVDYLMEKKAGRERSEFLSHEHCMKWKFILEE